MPKIGRTAAVVTAAILALGFFISDASAQGSQGADVIIRLRLSGETEALVPVRTCVAGKLSQMPDVKVANVSTEGGVRFVVDIVVSKYADDNILASLVVAETFPMEEFRPRIKEGEDADALLKKLHYYTLLRLHEAVSAGSYASLCLKITAYIDDKALSKEYTLRND
jgi:hypothetical protein